MDDKTHRMIVSKLDKWVESFDNPDVPFVGIAGDSVLGELSPRRIADEVKKDTAFGRNFAERWLDLAVEHIMNAQTGNAAEAPSPRVRARAKT